MVYFVMLYFVMLYFVMVYIIMLYFVACISGDLLKIKKCTMKGGDWCNGGCIANISALNETYRSLICTYLMKVIPEIVHTKFDIYIFITF
jgi:hypothetical protein